MIGNSNIVTVIIPHRKSTEDREDNLNTVIKYYKSFLPCAEFLVIEENDKITYNNPNAKTILAYNKGSFSRSWAFNVGTKLTKNPIIICVDSDIIVPEQSILKSISGILNKEFDFCTPYGVFYDFDLQGTNIFKLNNFHIDTLHTKTRYAVGHQNQYGGITIFDKELFLRSGGFNEEIRSWGCEDDIVIATFKKVANYQKLSEFNVYHLFHNKTSDCTPNNPFYLRNCQIMDSVFAMTKEEILVYINSYKNQIGNIEKYRDE